jgi:hypothetical protein
LDLLDIAPNEGNYGIHILMGYEGPDGGLNFTQEVITSYPINGHEPGVPFVDGWDSEPDHYDPNYVDPYYYSLNPQAKTRDGYPMYVGAFQSTGYWGEIYQSMFPNNGPYEFYYGDQIERGNPGYTWNATTSLVIMGPNNQPASTLITFTFGFKSLSNGQYNISQPTVQ